jgi:hypothetical protein
VDGGRVPGAQIIDPMWATLVHWHAVENPRLTREVQRGVLHQRILAHPDGARILEEFEAH